MDAGDREGFTGVVAGRRGRRLGAAAVAVAVVLLLAACGTDSDDDVEPQADGPSTAVTSAEDPLTGTYTADGRELFIECSGEGEPTMVLEVGEGRLHGDMAALRAVYESQLRVCSYDRANKGSSGAAPTPRSGAQLVSDLHGLLRAAQVPGPYVLVGHSAGGLLVQAFAAVHPDEVVGVVALNPVPPWKPWSRLGFAQMTALERGLEVDYLEGANGESLDYRDISRLIDEHPVPSAIPFHVVISTREQCIDPQDVCSRTYPAYTAIMRRLGEQWDQGRFSQVEASHEIHSDNTRAVQEAVDDVLSRAPGS